MSAYEFIRHLSIVLGIVAIPCLTFAGLVKLGAAMAQNRQ